MATVRNYTVPYLSGTYSNDMSKNVFVRLTNSRSVWGFAQYNPNWVHYQITDTPGNWLNGSAPTVTAQQMLPMYWGYNASAYRLNDTTFVIFATDNLAYYANYDYYVMEVGLDNTITQVDSGKFTNGPTVTASYTQANNRVLFTTTKDNTIVCNFIDGSGGSWKSRPITYNPSTKKLITSGATISIMSIGNYSYVELMAQKITGRDLFIVNCRVAQTNALGTTNCTAIMMDLDGNTFSSITTNNLPSVNNILVPLLGDRLASISPALDYMTVYDYNYSAKTFQTFSAGQTGVKNLDTSTNMYIPYGLGNSYLFCVARAPFYAPSNTSTPFRFKVFRALDRVTVEQSPSSSLDNNKGFGIATVPTITMHPNYNNQIPELNGNQLTYVGVHSGTSNPGWSVINLPSA